MEETVEQQEKDANMIIKQISAAGYTLDEAKRVICMLYVPDMNISRSGISRAISILEQGNIK